MHSFLDTAYLCLQRIVYKEQRVTEMTKLYHAFI